MHLSIDIRFAFFYFILRDVKTSLVKRIVKKWNSTNARHKINNRNGYELYTYAQ